MAKLLAHLDSGISTFAIDDDSTLIGRDRRCHIHIEHRSVSPMHCRVLRHGPDYSIEQLDPDTFTLLNGQVVVDGALHDGDRIELGTFVIDFKGDVGFSRDAPLFQLTDEDRQQPVEEGAPEEPDATDAGGGASYAAAARPGGQAAADAGSDDALVARVDREPALESPPLPTRDPSATWRCVQDGQPMGPTTLEVLVREIDEGRLSPESLVRGPTHQGPFVPAKEVRGIARFFGVCHACGTRITEKHVFCHMCGENVTAQEITRPPGRFAARRRRLLMRAVTTTVLAGVCVFLLSWLYRSDIWREAASESLERKIDQFADGARRAGARIVGPENVGFYREMLAGADRLSEQSHVAQAASVYEDIEAQFPGSRFATAAQRRRRAFLAKRYLRARDAAAQSDFRAALDAIEPATQDPLFFSLYPQAHRHIDQWQKKSSP